MKQLLGNWKLSMLMVGSGAALVFTTLAVYSWNISQNWAVMGISRGYEDQSAYSTLILMVSGLNICAYGAYRLLRNPAHPSSSINGLSSIFSRFLMSRRHRLVMIAATIIYAIFFAIVSGILVFQSSPSFSQEYGVSVPSVSVIECCGGIGQIPVFIVYLADNIGLLIVPVNLVIMFAVSFLVGLNVGIASFAYQNAIVSFTKRSWTSFLGAGIGLFTACPTCSSFFISSLLGVSGAFTVIAGTSWLQPLLVTVGLSILCIGPILTAAKAGKALACQMHSASQLRQA